MLWVRVADAWAAHYRDSAGVGLTVDLPPCIAAQRPAGIPRGCRGRCPAVDDSVVRSGHRHASCDQGAARRVARPGRHPRAGPRLTKYCFPQGRWLPQRGASSATGSHTRRTSSRVSLCHKYLNTHRVLAACTTRASRPWAPACRRWRRRSGRRGATR